MFALGRIEADWFPFVYQDGSKCWKLGKETNKCYHLDLRCLLRKNPGLSHRQLTPPGLDISNIVVTELMRGEFSQGLMSGFA